MLETTLCLCNHCMPRFWAPFKNQTIFWMIRHVRWQNGYRKSETKKSNCEMFLVYGRPVFKCSLSFIKENENKLKPDGFVKVVVDQMTQEILAKVFHSRLQLLHGLIAVKHSPGLPKNKKQIIFQTLDEGGRPIAGVLTNWSLDVFEQISNGFCTVWLIAISF